MSEKPEEKEPEAKAEIITPAELAELKKKAAERDEFFDRLQRALADYQNLRKRLEKDVATRSEDMLIGMVNDLLIALDHLDMALKSSSNAGEAKLQQGVEMIRVEIDALLSRQGIKQIPTEGRLFDPKLHEAILQETREGAAAGTILEEIRKGYQWRERILRPSQVKVAAEKKSKEQGS